MEHDEHEHFDDRALDQSAWDGAAAMSACASSSTPASCYNAICAGKRAGDPALQSSHALPHHKSPGAAANAAGVRAALSRLPQTTGLTNVAAAERHLRAHLAQNNAMHFGDFDVVRAGYAIELRQTDAGLGTLFGRFTAFDQWYKVRSLFEGEFMEQTARGSTVDTIRDDRDRMRVLFNHGYDYTVSDKVLGTIDELAEQRDGAHYAVGLFDTSYNRDLLPGLAAKVYGASMRMRVLADSWDEEPPKSDHNPDGIPERTITRMRVLEFGPVTFPANPGATAGVRSGTDEFYGRMAAADPPQFAEAVRSSALHVTHAEIMTILGLRDEDFAGWQGARSTAGGEQARRQRNDSRPPSHEAEQRLRSLQVRGIRTDG